MAASTARPYRCSTPRTSASLVVKWCRTPASVMPTARATAAMLVPRYPDRANREAAASRISSRRPPGAPPVPAPLTARLTVSLTAPLALCTLTFDLVTTKRTYHGSRQEGDPWPRSRRPAPATSSPRSTSPTPSTRRRSPTSPRTGTSWCAGSPPPPKPRRTTRSSRPPPSSTRGTRTRPPSPGATTSLFLQSFNLWRVDERIARFVLAPGSPASPPPSSASSGVRLYHDQALCKEPGGGRTPWHQDHYYWPLDTDRTITMWMPLDRPGRRGRLDDLRQRQPPPG